MRRPGISVHGDGYGVAGWGDQIEQCDVFRLAGAKAEGVAGCFAVEDDGRDAGELAGGFPAGRVLEFAAGKAGGIDARIEEEADQVAVDPANAADAGNDLLADVAALGVGNRGAVEAGFWRKDGR